MTTCATAITKAMILDPPMAWSTLVERAREEHARIAAALQSDANHLNGRLLLRTVNTMALLMDSLTTAIHREHQAAREMDRLLDRLRELQQDNWRAEDEVEQLRMELQQLRGQQQQGVDQERGVDPERVASARTSTSTSTSTQFTSTSTHTQTEAGPSHY